MSHYRGVRTKMRNLPLVHEILTERGYQPQCLNSAGLVVPLEQAEVLKIPAEQISENGYGRYAIRFELNTDGEVVTKTDTDILKTGRNSPPELVNRAGGGINRNFENEITTDWVIATTIQTAKAQGFNVYNNGIIREGNTVKIAMWRMPTTTVSTSNVKSSNTVVL